ncbi:tape measure protein [Pedobacter antarcticus]|uniref:tape measure protein n=1 Tax=Pedobacter antarcticus TaxID=34086 RepID=UPI00292D0984|nr:tape measure protein [Pedobacter antarcticus]
MSVSVFGGGLNFDATIDDSQFHAQIRKMEQEIAGVTTSVIDQGNQIESWAKKAATAATAFFSINAAQGFISSLIDIRSQFQQLDIAFSTMLKSKATANALMKDLVGFAAETPFGLKDAAGAAKQLLAYGTTASNIVGELRMLGDVASGVSVPIGDLVYLYGTLRTQGVAMTKDIREFAGRGIPIYSELAKVLKVNKDEVGAFVTAGKVGFKEVEQAFRNMTATGSMFGGLMEAQSKTWAGQIERFKDAWDVMLNEIGKSQEGLFAVGISGVTALVESYQGIIDIISISVAAYGVYRTALMATAAFERVSVASKFGLALAVNQESIARIANAQAMAVELRAEVSSLAAKRAAALQLATNDAALVKSAAQRLTAAQAAVAASSMNISASSREATAKTAQVASNELISTQEKASISRKAALAASSEFYTAKQNLETTAKVASSAATVELTAVESLNAAGKRILAQAQAAYNAVLAASPLLAFTAVVTALGVAIYSLTQVTNAAEVAQKVLSDSHEEGGKTADSQKRKVDQLIAVLKDETATISQKKAAYDKLQDTTDGVLKGYSLEEIAIGKASKSLDEYIAKIREAASARKAFAEFNELADRMDELERKGVSSIDTFSRLGRSLQNTFNPTSKGLSFGVWANELIDGKAASDRIVKQEKAVLQAAMDELKKEFGGKFSEIISGESDSALPDVKRERTVDVIDAEIKKLKENQTAVSQTAEKYNEFRVKIKALEDERLKITGLSAKASHEEDSSLKRKAEMLNRVYELNEKYSAKSLTDDEEKIQNIRNDFKALQRDIEVYNANPKNKKINPDLKPALEKALENQQYQNDTKKLEVELDKQKDLYSDFEDYRIKLGDAAAKERYGKELDISVSYLQQLEAERAKLLSKDPINMSGPELDRLYNYNKRIDEQIKAEKKRNDDLLKEFQSYNSKRKVLTENYKKDMIKFMGSPEDQATREIQYKEDLKLLDDANVQKLGAYKRLFEGVDRLSDEHANKVISDAQRMLDKLIQNGTISLELAKQITEKLRESRVAVADRLPENLIVLANELQSLSSIVSTVSQGFGAVLSNLANVVGTVGNFKKSLVEFNKEGATGSEKFAAGVNMVAIGLGAATSLIGVFTNSAKERRKAEEEYYASVLKSQNDYNLSLNEEIRLRSQINESVFIKDLKGRIIDGTAALSDANDKYLKSLEELQNGRAKLGQRNAVDPKNLLGGTASGAALGSLILPGIGTAIGAVAGFIGGLFGGKKKKDVFGGLLQEYPELIKASGEFNDALAQNLINNNLVDDKTKALLQNTLALAEARKAALEQINSVISDLAGNLGNDLRSALVDAFKTGEDSAIAFGKTVESVLENIISQMLFQAVFGESFDKLQKEMKESYDIGGDQSFVDDINRFYEQAGPLIDGFNQGLQAAKDQAAKKGLEVFGDSKSAKNGLSAEISEKITETTGTEISGIMRGQYDLTKQILALNIQRNELLQPIAKVSIDFFEIAKSNLYTAVKNEQNTFRIAQNTEGMGVKLDKIINNTSSQSSRSLLG